MCARLNHHIPTLKLTTLTPSLKLTTPSANLHLQVDLSHSHSHNPSPPCPYPPHFHSHPRTYNSTYSSTFTSPSPSSWSQIVRKHSESPTKPPLIVKMDELCGAICRYFYPSVVSGTLTLTLTLTFAVTIVLKWQAGYSWRDVKCV